MIIIIISPRPGRRLTKTNEPKRAIDDKATIQVTSLESKWHAPHHYTVLNTDILRMSDSNTRLHNLKIFDFPKIQQTEFTIIKLPHAHCHSETEFRDAPSKISSNAMSAGSSLELEIVRVCPRLLPPRPPASGDLFGRHHAADFAAVTGGTVSLAPTVTPTSAVLCIFSELVRL
jgi:hypothetical protein